MALILAKTATILLLVMTSFRVSLGAIYKVGDSVGWAPTKGHSHNVDYKKWALSKNFRAGDTLLFEYNPQIHNVMQVNRRDFLSCKPSDPISTYSTGKDLVRLNAAGHYYFVGPNHCEDGLRFEIRVSQAHNCQGGGSDDSGGGSDDSGMTFTPGHFSFSRSLQSFDSQLVTKLILVGGVVAYFAIAFVY